MFVLRNHARTHYKASDGQFNDAVQKELTLALKGASGLRCKKCLTGSGASDVFVGIECTGANQSTKMFEP